MDCQLNVIPAYVMHSPVCLEAAIEIFIPMPMYNYISKWRVFRLYVIAK